MNNLSWFLYLADVLPSFASGVGTASALTLFFGIPLWMLWYFSTIDDKPQYKPNGKLIYVFLVSLVVLALSSLIPSKETIYLIAGSEAGEAVVTSEEGKEILNDIHQVIRHQLSTLKGETE